MASSPSVRGRSRSRHAAGLPAVTAERIVEAAARLTAELGVENWTLRQLASEVDAYPAVIYHHVGDREAVVSAVVDRSLRMLSMPGEELPWREWFWRLLTELRLVLRNHPGVARRLSLYGPSLSAAAPTIDRGVRILQRDGFGEESTKVYILLLSIACQLIAVEDDRAADEAARRRGVESLSSYRDRRELPGLAALGESVHSLAQNPDELQAFFEEHYEYAVQRCLDGVAYRLDVLRRDGQPSAP
jgi:AcrR family transcriptional regulator